MSLEQHKTLIYLIIIIKKIKNVWKNFSLLLLFVQTAFSAILPTGKMEYYNFFNDHFKMKVVFHHYKFYEQVI